MKNTIFGILIGMLAMIATLLIVTNISKVDTKTTKEVSVSKIDAKKDYVYTSVTEKRTLEKGTDFEKEITANVPYININTSAIKKINDEIETYYNKIKSDPINYLNMKYEYFINNDYLSLVLTTIQESTTSPSSDSIVFTYNINTKTGQLVTNDELILSKNTTTKVVYTELLKQIAERSEPDPEFKDNSNDITLDRIKAIVSELQISTPMYLNDKGNLSAIVDTEITTIQNGRYIEKYDLGL